MGYKKQHELRRAENEVIFRQYNQRIKNQAADVLPGDSKSTYLVGFICECSNEDCQKRIEMPVVDFERYGSIKSFFVAPKHEQTDIERVVHVFSGYTVVEKYEVPPATDGVLNKT